MSLRKTLQREVWRERVWRGGLHFTILEEKTLKRGGDGDCKDSLRDKEIAKIKRVRGEEGVLEV